MTNAIKIGKGTLVLNDYIFTTLANGQYISLEPQDDLLVTEISANGTLLMAQNPKGKMFRLTIRVARGSEDYSFLLNLLNKQHAEFESEFWIEGTYTTTTFDGSRKKSETVNITGGAFAKDTSKMSDASGDIESGVATFEISCKATTGEA